MPLALVVGAAVVYGRVRAGARATLALAFGVFGVRVGTEAVYYTLRRPVRRRLHRVAVARRRFVLLGLGIVTLWRSPGERTASCGGTSGAP